MPEHRNRHRRLSRPVALVAGAVLALGVAGAGVAYARDDADPADRALTQRGLPADRDTIDPDFADSDRDGPRGERYRSERYRGDEEIDGSGGDVPDADSPRSTGPSSTGADRSGSTTRTGSSTASRLDDPNATEPLDPKIELAPPDPPGSLVMGTPCTKKAVACVSLKQNKSWLFKKDELTGETVIDHGPVPVRTGGPGKETPLGDFVVEWKNKNHKSGEYFVPHGCVKGSPGCEGAPMNWAVFFAEGGIAFHEGTLSIRSSGCVRLSAKEAEFYYTYLQLGDKVEVRN